MLQRCVIASSVPLRVRDLLLHSLKVERLDDLRFERVIRAASAEPAATAPRVEPANIRALRFKSDGVVRLCDIVLLPGFALAVRVEGGRGGFIEVPAAPTTDPISLYADDQLTIPVRAPIEVAAETIA